MLISENKKKVKLKFLILLEQTQNSLLNFFIERYEDAYKQLNDLIELHKKKIKPDFNIF